MFGEWISLRTALEDQCGVQSVLATYPQGVGREVALSVIRSLTLDKKNNFGTKEQVDWTMEVICYGLSLPLSDVETIKNCVFLYLDWITCVCSNPKPYIPHPVLVRNDFYFQKILRHMTNLFFPRDSSSVIIQVKLCSQVLHNIKVVCSNAKFNKSTWEAILKFYMTISGHLLSPPPQTRGLAEHLCEQLITTIFEVWLIACAESFPTPPMWCTLQDLVLSWRHHSTLIVQWCQLLKPLTYHLVNDRNIQVPNVEMEGLPVSIPNLSSEVTIQCWFRMLHLIGNPCTLSKPTEISNTEHFASFALEQGRSPEHHPCLRTLPFSFLKAMTGVSYLVRQLLGIEHPIDTVNSSTLKQPTKLPTRSNSVYTVGPKVSLKKHLSEGDNETNDVTSNFKVLTKADISQDINSVLHIVGNWLFEACLSGVDTSLLGDKLSQISQGVACLTLDEMKRITPTKNEFEPGRAEAYGILCQMYCHQSPNQAILPIYLARFYWCIAVGLCYQETRAGQVLGSILLNSEELLSVDLQGAQVLIPHFLQALEFVLPISGKDLNLGYNVSSTHIRSTSIKLLLSMVCLPMHFTTLGIQGFSSDNMMSSDTTIGFGALTFSMLKPRLTKLFVQALDVEVDPANIKMLLGGCMVLIEDTAVDELRRQLSIIPSITIANTLDTLDVNIENQSQKRPLPDKVFNQNEIGSIGYARDLNTTKGLFVCMSSLLCQKLMFAGTWRSDLNVTMTALELLSGMAELNEKLIDSSEAVKTINWICNYVAFQTNKAPPLHSRDLHSIIVAAFNTLSVWVLNHSWLLDDHQCLDAVLQVIELGISGCKSKPQVPDEQAAMKGDKDQKPASLRVKEAAEAVLSYLMKNMGFFPTPDGPEAASSIIEEASILNYSCQTNPLKQFHYYALDESTIVGILEDTVDKSKVCLPSVVAIMRGPSGKKVSLLQLRNFPRSKQDIAMAYLQDPGRPAPCVVPRAPSMLQHRCFPDEIKEADTTDADFSIPSLDSLLDEKTMESQNYIKKLMALQIDQEIKASQSSVDRHLLSTFPDPETEKEQPRISEGLQSCRLLLSHLGLLNLDQLEGHGQRSLQPLLKLDSERCGFKETLKELDHFTTRNCDTVFVFYVKSGQTDAKQIIVNEVPDFDGDCFKDFVHSLGWQANSDNHTGWTGNPLTSWKQDSDLSSELLNHDKTTTKFIYYSDAVNELAVIVPSLNISPSPVASTEEFAYDEEDKSPTIRLQRSESADLVGDAELEKPVARRKSSDPTSEGIKSISKSLRRHCTVDVALSESKLRNHSSQSETKVIVAWLQDWCDVESVPVLDLLQLCDQTSNNLSLSTSSNTSSSCRAPEKEIIVICVHPLKTGLFRVKVKAMFGSTVGGPLIDGMIVSRRILGKLVRNTAILACRRRRLEIDSYSPPHVCRKIKIQDIITQYKSEVGISEFYAKLFDP